MCHRVRLSTPFLPAPLRLSAAVLLALAAAGCTTLPTSGPSSEQVVASDAAEANVKVQVVTLDAAVARRIAAQRRSSSFAETLGASQASDLALAPGDSVEVMIWESPPATLFGGTATDSRSLAAGARAVTLPEQVVGLDGVINVPFAGRVAVKDRRIPEVEAEIVRRLTGKANQPEVVVRRTRSMAAAVTVVGEVGASTRVPLTPSGERLLDALAAAGGVRQPVNRITLQVTRGDSFHAMPLDAIIRDPRQNVRLRPGDVITALHQPHSFTALGATGKNEEIAFEAQGISLAQALARAGGLVDSRSDAQGVFVFRFEKADALDWPRQPVGKTAEGLVPVVYRVDLRDPASYFVMQGFAVNDKDLLYVSNAPAAELQKFLNLIFSIAYPVLNTISLTR
jgi:polysaccharide export outer membrane protein